MLNPLLKLPTSMLRNIKRLTNAGRVRYTYDGDDRAKPHVFGQQPYTITEIHLNREQNDCAHDGNVYGGVMRTVEALDVAESANKPIVDICPSQRCLGGLHREDKID
jgi:hypothetical protein